MEAGENPRIAVTMKAKSTLEVQFWRSCRVCGRCHFSSKAWLAYEAQLSACAFEP